MVRLAPSIIAADYCDLAGALAACAAGGADLVHVDVMDGRFVPNLTIGMPGVAALARRTRLPLDVHLMVEEPERLIASFLAAGARRLALHWEAVRHLDRALAEIRAGGAAAGVALNPATPVEWLHDLLPALDFVLLMSVNPGFSGQRFIPYVREKAERLRALAAQRAPALEIEMDGGIDLENIARVVASGVDTVVVGNAVFSQPDPAAAIGRLRAAASNREP